MFWGALTGQAQGSFTALQTEGGSPLVSDQQTLNTIGFASPLIAFNFGFATSEVVLPGTFLDSFTVTFQDSSLNTAVVATMDASGVMWAPATPGGVVLREDQVQRQSISAPGAAPVSGRGTAFSVLLPVPAQFAGSSVTVHFDLFDNQNGIPSLGWYDKLTVVSVPEPGWLLLFGFGALGLVRANKQRR